MARRSRRSRHLGAMSPDQTANLLIGVGAVVGIGTLAYYFMRKPDETASSESSTVTETSPGASQAASVYAPAPTAYTQSAATWTSGASQYAQLPASWTQVTPTVPVFSQSGEGKAETGVNTARMY